MKTVLFFNGDSILSNYIKTHPSSNFQSIIFKESLNHISLKELEPYKDTEAISVFVHSEPINNEKLDFFKNLKIIATRSTGYNHIDLSYCYNRNIKVLNVPRYGESTVAEFAFGLLLNLTRHIIQGRNGMAHNNVNIEKYMGFDLMGKTIGIIGTGSIGQHMIQISKGFQMKVIAYDLYPKDELKDLYVESIDELLKKSDIISLHIPSTRENYHLLDEQAFKKMKKGVIIINTARGDLIDTQALYAALKNKTVGGAGLDVLENEDFLIHDDIEINDLFKDKDFLLDSALNLKLLQFKNVIATPHIAFNSIDAVNRINETTFQNIQNFFNGKTTNEIK